LLIYWQKSPYMQIITPQPSLVDQVYEAILSEIMDGKFGPDARLVQEELAEAFGVSRQPVQQALAGYQQAIVQQQNQAAAAQPAAAGSINAGFQAGAERKPLQLPPFPGLDARGLHWHVHSATLGCKTFPCNAPFCQACGVHHHSANECRKRFYNNPGANLSGYWSEQRPNGTPLRNPAPAATANVAVQYSSTPFPTPYQLNGNTHATPSAAPGSAAPAQQAAHQQQGSVNHYSQQQQQPPTSNDGSGKSL
jgi:hypothetical protein